jgi:tetratricopeptide (TPR) repeat protein
LELHSFPIVRRIVESSSPLRETLFRWLLALGCFALLLLFFCPPLSVFLIGSRIPETHFLIELRRAASVLAQVEHPGMDIPDKLHAVIQWRLLFPVLGHVLNLPTPVFFGLAPAGCVVVLGFVITLLRRRGLGFESCGLAALSLGAASWCFTSVGWLGYFDSWLALGLLLLAFARSPWTVWAACLWAPWVDERFVIAAPLALLCRYLLEQRAAVPAQAGLARWRPFYLVPAALLAVFLVVRLVVLPGYSAPTATFSGYMATQKNLDAPPGFMAWGLWEGLRAGWGFAVLALWLCRREQGRVLALAGGMLAVVFIGLVTAQDFSRSMTMLLPAALCGLLLAVEAAPGWLTGALRACALAALAIPAHHVMSDRVVAIHNFNHEIYLLNNPPRLLMPELYELQGIHSMETGDFAGAEAQLTLALRLAEAPVSASKQRGILRASQGRWAEAREDFATMARHDAENPDAWFMCSQAALNTGDAATARAEMQKALALAPEGWSKRPDVLRYLGKLNGSR